MSTVRSVKAATTLGRAGHEANCVKFTQFILYRAKSEATHIHQLANISLPLWRREEQPKHLRAHLWKKHIQNLAS